MSYSHADEAWAKWLHRALEAYRVPKKLRDSGEPLPRRLTPVFRDRDDLSSSADLNKKLREALHDSAALIVVCSDRAAESRWVNEEVRYFRSLGRASHIYCVIVGGTPDPTPGVKSCFPPALLESDASDSSSIKEPLATDARETGDGRHLALQKVIAGLLGVRLDELRNRDAVRARQRKLLGSATIVVATALVLFTYFTWQSELRERQSAEQLASFIVDLGEDLKTEVDLVVLNLISSKAISYLSEIEPNRLSPETGIKVALAFRQIGQVSEGQGRFTDAEHAYLESRKMLSGLIRRNPNHIGVLFELAQSEYFMASHYLVANRFEDAETAASSYSALADQLYQSDPNKLEWQLERSYAATGLLVMNWNSGRPVSPRVLRDAEKAVDVALGLYKSHPNNSEILANYSSTLGWSADIKLLACNLEEALEDRQNALTAIRKALSVAPTDNDLRESFAYAHSAVASVYLQLGELSTAEGHLRTSIEIFADMVLRDASNELLREELEWRELRLIRILLGRGGSAEASALLDKTFVKTPASDTASRVERRGSDRYQQRLLLRSRQAKVAGDSDQWRNHLSAAIDSINEHQDNLTIHDARRHAELASLWKMWVGDWPDNFKPDLYTRGNGERSCNSAMRGARLAYVNELPSAALEELKYLRDKGYRGQDAAELCSAIPGCDL